MCYDIYFWNIFPIDVSHVLVFLGTEKYLSIKVHNSLEHLLVQSKHDWRYRLPSLQFEFHVVLISAFTSL